MEDNEHIKQLQKKGGDKLPMDANFQVKEERGCTDILFLIFYIIFWALMIFVGVIGFVNGDPNRLTNGYDFNGNTCGQGSQSDKSYVYYPNPFGNSTDLPDLTWAICVKQCPFSEKMPVDMCQISFKVQTESSLLSPSKTITCGGGSDGKTDMSQFSAVDQVLYRGYTKYCLSRVPVCTCSAAQASQYNVTAGSGLDACCDGSSPQKFISDPSTPNGSIPVTRTNPYPMTTLLGASIGSKFGPCFFSYPSMPISTSLNRCIPVPSSAKFKSSGNSTSPPTISSAFLSSLGASDNSSSSFDSAISSVLGVSAGPQQTFSYLVGEVVQNKWVIIGSAGLALVVALIYTQLLRFVAGPMTWTLLAVLWLLLVASTVVLAVKAGFIRSDQVPLFGSSIDAVTLPSSTTMTTADTNRLLVSIAAGVVGVATLSFTVFLVIFIPRINLAIQVIETAGQCLSAIPTALLLPLGQWVAFCCLFVWWVFVFVYLAASGKWDQSLHQYVWDDTIRRAIIFHFFGLLWTRAMILAVGNLIIAGAAGEWFFAEDKRQLKAPVLSATRRACRYHLGTAAFGSFLIALVQFIRWVFRYYMYKLKKMNPDSRIVKFLACIGECCLWCLEKFLNFVNKNAYIQTAIVGTSFCSSAVAAFNLLLRNFLRLGAMTVITSIYLQIGKLFVAVMTGFICALIIAGGDINNITQAPCFSVTIIILMAFGIGSAFLDVWDMVVETLFQCFCMDQEMGCNKTEGGMKDLVGKNQATAEQAKALAACTLPGGGDGGGGAPGASAVQISHPA